MKIAISLIFLLTITFILSGQEVGINKTEPEYTLDVRSTSNEDAAQLNVSNQDKSRYLRIYSGSSLYPQPSISIAPERSLLFASFDDAAAIFTEYMRISSSGNVGIGTTAPIHKLDVNGNVKVAGTISGVVDPISAQDAATKNYVDRMSEMMLDAGLNGIVEDIDGNVYKTIKIGSQVWTVDNLKTTRYNDGTVIPEVTDSATWDALTTPAYCYYDNDSTLYAKIYGGLYNYYVVAETNSKNVCPEGWDVPTKTEWIALQNYLKDNGYAFLGSGAHVGKSMAATFRWNSSATVGAVGYDIGSNNQSGFGGLPGGSRGGASSFILIGDRGLWWSSTDGGGNSAFYRSLWNSEEHFPGSVQYKKLGFSIRCLRD